MFFLLLAQSHLYFSHGLLARHKTSGNIYPLKQVCLRLSCFVLICKHGGFVSPRVWSIWGRARVSVRLRPHVAPVISEFVATAGRQGSRENSWFPPGVPLLLCPHFQITFTVSQARYDTGAAAALFLNCLLNHTAIHCFSDTFQGQRCATF